MVCRIRFTFRQSFAQVLFILMNKYWTANSSTFGYSFHTSYRMLKRQIDSDVILWDDFISGSSTFSNSLWASERWTQWKEITSTSQNCCKLFSVRSRPFTKQSKQKKRENMMMGKQNVDSGPPPPFESIRYMVFMTIAH